MPEPTSEMHRLRFTGSGKEYFKIWIVSLLLSIVTLGMYASWAKVRRLQYFASNTQLAGTPFDFDGNPTAVLRNRVLVFILLCACLAAFSFSKTAGTALSLAVLLAVPWLLRNATKFRLQNTRYRGVPLNFSGTLAGAYAAYLPPLAILLVPAAIVALQPPIYILLALIPFFLGWPLMRRAIKRYRHGHLQWGPLASSFHVAGPRFYLPYLQSIGLLLLVLANAVALLMLATVVSSKMGGSIYEVKPRSVASLSMGVTAAFIIYLFLGPDLRARTASLAWCATAFPGVWISSQTKPGAYLMQHVVSAILTLLSLGMYRPFAVVRAYRHRLELTTVTSDGSIEFAAAAASPSQSKSFVDSLQQRWYAALLALLLLAAGAASFVQWGMPALAERIVADLPPSIDQGVGDAALRAMEASHLLSPPTVHSGEVLAQVQAIFKQILPPKSRMPMRLVVRGMWPHGPTAFSLPNGTIVMTEDMLNGLDYRTERFSDNARAALAGVMTHEIGHIERRHAMRAAIGSSMPVLVSAALTGDFGKVVAADPTLMLKMNYSREMEAEADDYAIERMRQAGLPVAPLADLYDDLAQSLSREDRETPAWMAVKFSYLRSHPPSPERSARFRSGRQSAAP